MSFPFISAEEAAAHINNGDNVALSGFTASGTPKLVTIALAERAKQFHEKGSPSKSIFTPGLPLTTSLTVRFLVRRPSTSVRLIKARLTPAKLLTTEKYPTSTLT